MFGFLQDDKGNNSSMRVLLVVFMLIICACIITLLVVVVQESNKATPDYSGLAAIISAFLGGGVISLISKAVQKKYENEH